MKEFTHTFIDHLEIAAGKEKEKAETLTLPSPSNYVIGHVTVLDQEFGKAMLKMADQAQEQEQKDKGEVSGKEIFMLLSAGGANLKSCFDAIKQICIKQGKINKHQKITDHIFNEMSYDDTKAVLGGYINDFLFSSLVD